MTTTIRRAYTFIICKLYFICNILRIKREITAYNSINLLTIPEHNKKILWAHGASVGEIELLIPLIEKFSASHHIIISTFSLSGINYFKSTKFSCFILPLDTPENAKRVMEKISPDIVLWANNELWLNYLTIIRNKNIPLFLLNAFFKNTSYVFPYKKYILHCFTMFTGIHTSNTNSSLDKWSINYKYTQSLKLEKALLNSNKEFVNKTFEKLANNYKLIILGSIYTNELRNILPVLEKVKNSYLLIFPHHLDTKNCILFKQICLEQNNTNYSIIEEPNILKYAYRYAEIAYVGGGFKNGTHNIFEALIYKKHIIIGPKNKYHPEICNWPNKNQIIIEKNIGNLTYTIEECMKSIPKTTLPNISSPSEELYEWINKIANNK
jgi:3-deoxy-D-manno-octulosonic-acid transferase